MPPVILIAILAFGLALGAASWLLLAGPTPTQQLARKNLTRGFASATTATSARRGTSRSLFATVVDSPSRRGRLERLLTGAGRPASWTVDRLLALKLMVPIVIAAVAMLFSLIVWSPLMLGLFLVLIVAGFFAPDIMLYNEALRRQQAIDLELPDTLDQMSIGVQAGLGFDAAMLRVARHGRGILAGELMRTMQDIQVGQPRRAAYEDLIARTRSVPLRRFVRTVVQAEAYGIPLSEVLHTQADEMRRNRRAVAERKAMEIPVKVVFPLIVCILPALFVVILGPAAINIMGALSVFGP